MSLYVVGWLFPVISFSLMVMSFLFQFYYLFALITLALATGSAYVLKCPKCGLSVYMRGESWCAPWPTRECTKCHADLTQVKYFR